MNIVELKLGRMWMRRNRQRKSFIQSCLARRLVSIYCVALLLLFIFLPAVSAHISIGDSIGDPVDKNTIYEGPIDDVSIGDPIDDVSIGDPIDDVSIGDPIDKNTIYEDSIGDPVDKNTIYEDSIGDSIDKNTIYETTYYTSEGDGTAEDIVTLSVGVGDITAGNQIEVAIEDTQGSACVNRMDFTSNKNLADVHVHVTRLKERPEEIQKEPKRNGTIYEYLDLKITTDDIYLSNMSTRIRFNVSKEWINENDIDISTIRLMRYHNDTWQELNTTFLLDKNTTNASFIAETPGFSTFAVVGSANVMSSDTYAPETANIPLEAIIGIITAIVALLIIVLFKARYIYFGDNHTVEKPKKKN